MILGDAALKTASECSFTTRKLRIGLNQAIKHPADYHACETAVMTHGGYGYAVDRNLVPLQRLQHGVQHAIVRGAKPYDKCLNG
ncbi:hypothetical protein D3C78_988970 [compost metagenome]